MVKTTTVNILHSFLSSMMLFRFAKWCYTPIVIPSSYSSYFLFPYVWKWLLFLGYLRYQICCCSWRVQDYFCISVMVRNKAETGSLCSFTYTFPLLSAPLFPAHAYSVWCVPVRENVCVCVCRIRAASHWHRWSLIRKQRDREADRQNHSHGKNLLQNELLPAAYPNTPPLY